MTIHVDDFRVTGLDLNKDLDWLKAQITIRFDIKQITDGRYLGLKIDRTEDGISLFQELFIDKLLYKFEMEDCHPALIPLDPRFKPNIDSDNDLNIDPRYNHEFIKHSY